MALPQLEQRWEGSGEVPGGIPGQLGGKQGGPNGNACSLEHAPSGLHSQRAGALSSISGTRAGTSTSRFSFSRKFFLLSSPTCSFWPSLRKSLSLNVGKSLA